MKILIAVPCMDEVKTTFAQSLATLNKVGECAVAFKAGSLIYSSRDSLAKQAVDFGADYVLWLDSDMAFEPDLLTRLLAQDKDIVSGLYFRRVYPFKPVIFRTLEEKGGVCFCNDYNNYPSETFECAGFGFGCVLMKTDVLRGVTAKFGKLFAPEWGMGEDVAFCYRARQAGYKLYVDPTIKLGHTGTLTVTEDLFLQIRDRL